MLNSIENFKVAILHLNRDWSTEILQVAWRLVVQTQAVLKYCLWGIISSQGYYLDEWLVCALNQVKFDTYVTHLHQNHQILDFKECH